MFLSMSIFFNVSIAKDKLSIKRTYLRIDVSQRLFLPVTTWCLVSVFISTTTKNALSLSYFLGLAFLQKICLKFSSML